jgi:N-acetylglucosaminyldiphosphoundecaprenol N-acetyl-beta-D-mannosaminyltransferase
MIDIGKRNVVGCLVDGVDYEAAVDRVLQAAREWRPYAVAALAIHGAMVAFSDPKYRYRLNQLDLVVPDGQGIRWALNWLHRIGLPDRVYGPKLTLLICARAAEDGLPIFLYGSEQRVLDLLTSNLCKRFPGLVIAGSEPPKLGTVNKEREEIAARIRASGARITFVGLGCPRQEVFVHEYRDILGMPTIAVGAAFHYHAGLLKEPPQWVQRWGLHGFYRMLQEPRRLWKRFLLLPPLYLALVALQLLGLWRPEPQDAPVVRNDR